MSLLIDMFKEEAKKSKKAYLSTESRTPLAFPTGLDLLDFKNGKAVFPEGHKPYLSLGITEGTYVMWIGNSGTGKTSVAIQAGFNIIKNYENSDFFHFDIENATDKTRVAKLTGLPMSYINKHYFHRNTGISSESFYETIIMLASLKTGEKRSEFEVNTGRYDENGNEIVTLAPTLVLLDSLPMLVPEKISEEEELSGQMSQTSTARTNASVFRRILPRLKDANIILFVIMISYLNK